MNADQYWAWQRCVRAFDPKVLTATQKIVLLSLADFSDYPAGTRAHPGVPLLAQRSGGLGDRVVGSALERGQALGLIERTKRANAKRRLAAEYRLLPALLSGTTVPMNDAIDRHGDADETSIDRHNGADENEFHRHEPPLSSARDNALSGTTVPPTYSVTPTHENTEESARLRNGGTSLAAGHTDADERTHDDDDWPLDPRRREAISQVVLDFFTAHPNAALSDRRMAEDSGRPLSEVHQFMAWMGGFEASLNGPDSPLILDAGRDRNGDRVWRAMERAR